MKHTRGKHESSACSGHLFNFYCLRVSLLGQAGCDMQQSFLFLLSLGDCAVISMQWPSFLSFLSLSIHVHFWSAFILVPVIGATFPGFPVTSSGTPFLF